MSDDDRLHLTRLEVRNFKRIRAGVWEIDPGLSRLTSGGKNKQGKTSFMHAVRCLFEGAGASPPDPIHDEADDDDESFVRGCISNGWTIQRKFTEKKPKGYLKVVGPDGLEGKQGNIDPWLGNGHFNPLAFFDLTSEEQARALLSLSSVEDLEEKLEALESLEDQYYEERTPYISEKRRLRGVEKPEGERPEPVSVAEEMERLDELHEKKRAWDAKEEDLREVREGIQDLRDSVDDLLEDEERLEAKIARLQKQLAHVREEKDGVEEMIQEKKDAAREIEETLEGRPDLSGPVADCRRKIDRAEEIQEELEPWKEYDRAQEKLPDVEAKVDELTEAIKETREERDRLIAEADFPVPGLNFSPEGEVMLNDHPLEQASGRERIELAVTAALGHDPDLRLVLVDEAGDVDQEGLENLAVIAEEHELDIIVARLGLEGPGELEVVDGWGPVPIEELAPDEEE